MKRFRTAAADHGRLFLVLIPILVLFLTGSKCDMDGDGYSWPADCDDNDPESHPNALEQPDIKDNNCNGFQDEPPVGFEWSDFSMQGAASAVARYNDYVYVSASAVLQVYHVPETGAPSFVRELPLRDSVRKMVVDGSTLFLAARGAGLLAYDLADPEHPEFKDGITGYQYNLGNTKGTYFVALGVDAKDNVVAVAMLNYVPQSAGGVDAAIYDYNPAAGEFSLRRYFEAQDVRGRVDAEYPISTGLTDDLEGLYIGFGFFGAQEGDLSVQAYGELAYVDLTNPAPNAMNLPSLGLSIDFATKGHDAFVAVSNAEQCGVQCPALVRVHPTAQGLEQTDILMMNGASLGGSVDLDETGDFLNLGLLMIHQGHPNLYAYTDLDNPIPTLLGSATTMDWIYDSACQSLPGVDRIFVADEWGGFQVWESAGGAPMMKHRFETGTLSERVWNDGSLVYSAKRGAGLWFFDESDPDGEQVAVEWVTDCCTGCECPQGGLWPAAIFVSGGTSHDGRVAIVGGEREDLIGLEHVYFMMYEKNGNDHEIVYSDYIGTTNGRSDVKTDGDLLFVSAAMAGVRVYQHCPESTPQVRSVGSAQDIPFFHIATETAVYGDYLFVGIDHTVWTTGGIRVYRYRSEGTTLTCPDVANVLDELTYIGTFAVNFKPRTMLIDTARKVLFVGASATSSTSSKLVYFNLPDLGTQITETTVAQIDTTMTSFSPGLQSRLEDQMIGQIKQVGDYLYIADEFNGLYKFSLTSGCYVAHYPGHRGEWAFPYMIESPLDVMPLLRPKSLAIMPSGKLAVQEFEAGRVVLLEEIANGDHYTDVNRCPGFSY